MVSLELPRVAAALPGYDLGGELGRGSWGPVREGRHRQTGRLVAIKELPQPFAADPAVRARFAEEAALLARLDHPHVLAVLDHVERDDICLLVMEKLPGGSVWGEFCVQGMVPERACAVVLAAAAGLHHAHGRGVLHRGVTPENLMYSTDGVVKVADLGLARVLGGAYTLATTDGTVLGTPAYLAPEQARGEGLSAATDVYALATVLYELLAGTLPIVDDGHPLQTVRRKIDEAPVPLIEVAPHIPPGVASVVMQGLSRHLDDRLQTAEEFGLAVAMAASEAWGCTWLGERGGMATLASTSLLGAAQLDGVAAPPAVTECPPAHPAVIGHPRGLAAEVGTGQVLPVRVLTVVPPSPRLFMIGAAAAAGLALAVAYFGAGSPARSVPDGTTVNSLPVSADTAIPLALDDPLTIEVPVAGSPGSMMTARVTVAGVEVAASTEEVADIGGGRYRMTFDLGRARYLLASEGTLHVETDQGVSTLELGVVQAHNRWLTALAVPAIAIGLFALAYAEAMLVPLRAGRFRFSSLVGLGVTCGLFGATLWALGGVVDNHPLTRGGLTLCVLGAAAAGVLYGFGRMRWARRRRSKRAFARRPIT